MASLEGAVFEEEVVEEVVVKPEELSFEGASFEPSVTKEVPNVPDFSFSMFDDSINDTSEQGGDPKGGVLEQEILKSQAPEVPFDKQSATAFVGASFDNERTAHESAPFEQDTQAEIWAELFNAEHASEKTESARSSKLAQKVQQFKDKQDVEVLPEVRTAISKAVSSDVFDGEIKNLGILRDDIKEALINISKVETSGGSNNKISSGNAGGFLQVIPSTFKDLIKRKIIGEKGFKYLGKTKEELLDMSNNEIAEYLRDNSDAGVLFGTGAYLDKLRVFRKRNKKNEDK